MQHFSLGICCMFDILNPFWYGCIYLDGFFLIAEYPLQSLELKLISFTVVDRHFPSYVRL